MNVTWLAVATAALVSAAGGAWVLGPYGDASDDTWVGGAHVSLSFVGHDAEAGTWDFELENRGPASVSLAEGCGRPWGASMSNASGPVPFQPALAQCQGYGYERLLPGQAWTFRVSWDGSLYEDVAETPTGRAAAGEYTLVVVAGLETEAHGYEDVRLLEVSVPVTLPS